MSTRNEIFFATCAPGLEPLLHEEAKELRLPKIERQVGGIRFEGSIQDAWRANYHLRTAIRVLVRLSRFKAPDEDSLYKGVHEIDWARYLRPDGVLWIDAQSKDSALNHSRFVAQLAKDAIVDAMRKDKGERPSIDRESADLRLHLHLYRDRVTLSIDTSGESLHKRGWRQAQGLAPLSETLAAAMVMASGWDKRSPLIDPFCGSGTLLIEAAMIAAGIPPGVYRKNFGFQLLPEHDAKAYAHWIKSLPAQAPLSKKLQLLGSDNSRDRLREAETNAAAAGLNTIQFEQADVREFSPRKGWNGWIVTNPPYGKRIDDIKGAHALYRTFGDRLRNHCDGYTLALLTGDPTLAEALELPNMNQTSVIHGGIDCFLLRGQL